MHVCIKTERIFKYCWKQQGYRVRNGYLFFYLFINKYAKN